MASTNLTDRLVPEIPESEPEDFLSSSLAVIFPDAVANQHGDADTTLLYTSPSLPRPLRIELADPSADEDRLLFGHYLWNASLLAAEFIDTGTTLAPPKRRLLGMRYSRASKAGRKRNRSSSSSSSVGATNQETTAPASPRPAPTSTSPANPPSNSAPAPPSSMMAALLGAASVTGHAWGEMDDFARGKKHAYDVVIAADCLMRGFFDPDALAAHALQLDRIWEVDCLGNERAWVPEREGEEATGARRWLAVGIVKSVAEA
ncbi:unnamed protein product [Parascedosporium putredinis]|uniref:Uncharacterized protein n=1 Tax=Parascedosporium putredinis TaxID=1442378 RepID=A0A9P1H019_9PEZI|nr:unnamed protein product [Parascedosporium putredinis]CAI7991324.1 unnamed protein product [Parascedosporium putredinis]